LAQSHIYVTVYLLHPAAQLLNPVQRILDTSGQLAHLRFQPIHSQLSVNRGRP
jgi:hypothetical protein